MKYKVNIIYHSMIYAKKLKTNQQLSLYYLAVRKNIWEPLLVVQYLKE